MNTVKIVRLRMVREKTVRYEPVSSVQDAVNISMPIFKDSYREQVVVVGLDNALKPTVLHVVGVGGPTQSTVVISSILKPLLLSNATSCIILHNHPADKLTPSQADREITKRVADAGRLLEIPLVDHIIVNGDCSDFFSFKQNGGI